MKAVLTPRDYMDLADLISNLDWTSDVITEFVDEHGAGNKGEAILILDNIKSATDYLANLKYSNG
jgi:hypothetical protein